MEPRPFLAAFSALALAAAAAFGQEGVNVPGFGPPEAALADAIGIAGPAEAEDGQKVTLYLTGTPPLNLAEPLVDQLGWLMGGDRMFAYLQAPGRPMVALDVEGTIVFGRTGATMRPQVGFAAEGEGQWRVIVDWNYRQNQLVEHLVAVKGKEGPDPGPEPGLLSVLVSYESADQTSVDPAQADLLTDPHVRAYLDSHCVLQNGQPAWRFLDFSNDDGSRMPSEWQTAIARAHGRKTPWLIIDNGKATYEGPCPPTAAGLLAKLKEYGGE